jgi:MFS family permease
MFATTFTATILAVSLKTIAVQMHSTPQVIAWVVTAPALGAAVAVPIFGRLGDIRGHRRVYLVGFSVSIVFNLLTSVATSPIWLIGCRTIAQVAGTATIPASFAMLFRSFPPEERVRASAWSSGILSAAAVSGLVIGGPIIDHIGWRPLFVIQAGLAMATLLPAVVILRADDERARVPLDLPGAVALAFTVFCITFGVNRITATGLAPLPLVLLAAAPFAAWALVRIERRSASPLLPLGLVRNHNVRVVALCAFVLGAAWMGTFIVTPLLLQTVFGFSATSTSLVTLFRTASIVVAAPVASRLGTRWGEQRVLRYSVVGVTGGLLLLALGASAGSLAVLIPGMVVSGWAWGHAQPAMVAVVANAVDEDDFGLATSLQQMANQVGAVIGLGLISAIAANATTRGPFTGSYLIAGGLGVAAAVVVSRVRGPSKLVAIGVFGEDEVEALPILREQFSPARETGAHEGQAPAADPR